MKPNIHICILIIASFAMVQKIHGQSKPNIINSASWSAILNNNIFDMSVGEMTMTSTFSSGNLITTQGFLQPAEMQTGIDDLMLIADTKIHPNPTVGIINCQISSHSIGEVVYRIIDASGKTISQSKQLIEPGYNHHTIDISTTMTGVYYLEIVTSEQTIHKGKAYKIIKI